jgi:hypothetical protein
MLGGLFFILLHTRFVVGHWVWDLAYWPVILVQFMLLGVWVWLIGVLVLVVTFSWFGRRRPALREIEIGVVYLWMSFCIMPVLDVVHLLGVRTMDLTQRLHWRHFLLAHISLLLTAPNSAMVLIYCLLRKLGDISRGHAWLLAFALSFGARFVVEPSGVLLFFLTSRFGITLNFWLGQLVSVVATLVVLLLWWSWLRTRSWRSTLAAVMPITVALLLVSVGAWQLSRAAWLPGGRPAPLWLPPVTLSPLPAQLTAQGPRWDAATPSRPAADAVAAVGDFLDGLNHRVSVVMPLGLVSGNILERVRQFECQAWVAARDGRIRDGSPWMRCDLVDPADERDRRLVPGRRRNRRLGRAVRKGRRGAPGPGAIHGLRAELELPVRGAVTIRSGSSTRCCCCRPAARVSGQGASLGNEGDAALTARR